jgi:hypothetical protein
MLVEQGLFHLLRLVRHAGMGSAEEITVLVDRRQDIRSAARFLLASGIASRSECEAVIAKMEELESQFAAPKRAPEKLAAADRLENASRLRESGDRRKIAPSSMTAYAASKQLTKRTAFLERVSPYFTGKSVRICTFIRSYYARVEELWRFFDAGGAGSMSYDDLVEGLRYPESRDVHLQRLCGRLRAYKNGISGCIAMPYRTVCEHIARDLALLDACHENGIDTTAREVAQEIRQMLRQLRMIYHLEIMLVGRLTVYLERTPKGRRSLADEAQMAFRKHFAKVAEKIRSFGPGDLDLAILMNVHLLLDEAEKDLADDLAKVKDHLKMMTAVLATAPVKLLSAPHVLRPN